MSDINSELREPLNTKRMLEDAFLENLSGNITIPEENTKSEIFEASTRKDYNTEELLSMLYDIRDDLVEGFEGTNVNSPIATNLTCSINKVGVCIKKLGGTAETFNPLDHVSGLQSPNVVGHAHQVIETTKQCYSIGQITKTSCNQNGEITIVFAGKDGETKYTATGTISAKSWAGNEAIDYIYTPGAGKMSVKAFEDGRWIDRSSDDNYNIYWELEEADINSQADVENIMIEASEKSSEENENLEEVDKTSVNNNDNINDDFDIIEKI